MQKEKKPKRKTGRPLIPIDETQLMGLAERQWAIKEMAAFFHCNEDTLHARFSDKIKAARESGLGKLRDDLWRRARGGVMKETRADGSIQVIHTKASDRLFIQLMNRYHGSIPKDFNATHDGKIEVVITDYRSKKETK